MYKTIIKSVIHPLYSLYSLSYEEISRKIFQSVYYEGYFCWDRGVAEAEESLTGEGDRIKF